MKIQSEQLDRGLKPATVNRKTEIIRAILSFSAKNRRIPHNPGTGFQKLREVREGVQFWEPEEARHFLAQMHARYPVGSAYRWVYVVYLMALNTGMRAGEIWGFHPRDIVRGGELLLVQRQFDRVVKLLRPTKGKKPRHVPCNPELLEELQSLIVATRTRPEECLF